MLLETLNAVLDIIRIDFLIGFGLYSIFYFITSQFKRDSVILKEFDSYACRTVVFLGLVYFVVFVIAFVLFCNQSAENDKREFITRITGPYWFGYFLQPLFWIGLTQLMRIKALQRSTIFRVIMSLMFVLTFELFVIITTSLERDYLPGSWSNSWTEIVWAQLSWPEIVLGVTMKVMGFIFLVSIYYYGSKKIKTLSQSK